MQARDLIYPTCWLVIYMGLDKTITLATSCASMALDRLGDYHPTQFCESMVWAI